MKQTTSVETKYIDRIIDYSRKSRKKHLLHSYERVYIFVKYSLAALLRLGEYSSTLLLLLLLLCFAPTSFLPRFYSPHR
jgi:hypothetical protein